MRKIVVGEKEENEERGVSEKKAGDGNGRREKRRKVLVFMLHIGALLAMVAFPKRRFSSRHAGRMVADVVPVFRCHHRTNSLLCLFIFVLVLALGCSPASSKRSRRVGGASRDR